MLFTLSTLIILLVNHVYCVKLNKTVLFVSISETPYSTPLGVIVILILKQQKIDQT